MDKAITTALLVIASMVMVVTLFNAGYPAVMRSSDAMNSMQARLGERMRSQVEIIHISGELDQNGTWQDTNGDGRFNVFAWVKNVGDDRIAPVDQTDVFFGPQGNFARIPNVTRAGGNYPSWTYIIENDSEWNPRATVRMIITYAAPLAPGRYYLKVTTPNGVQADDYFSM